MSDTFASKVGPSGSTPLGREFFNDLHDRLKNPGRVGNLDLRASTGRAVVHPDDDGLLPGQVAVSDLTEWAGMQGPSAYVEWTLDGPGHLLDSEGGPTSSRQTPPGSSVTWGWHSSSEASTSYYDGRETRAWDATPSGRALPADAVIEARAYVLTSEVTVDPVETTGDLETVSGATGGDRVLVGGNRTVYELDGSDSTANTGEYVYDPDQDGTADGVWKPATGPYFTEIGAAQQIIQVEPGEDPDYLPSPVLKLRPSQEVAYIDSDGVAEIEVYDESLFQENASDVSRTVTGQVGSQNEGESITIQSAAGPGDNLLNYSREDKKLSVGVSATGEVTLTVDYDITEGGTTTTKTVKRHLLVKNLETGPLGATFDPKLPAISIAPGNGSATLTLGSTAELAGARRAGTFTSSDSSHPVVRAGQTREIGKRLDLFERVEDRKRAGLDDFQFDSLSQAAFLIQSVLQTPNARGLGIYELELHTPDVPRNKVVATEHSEFRVVENLGTEGEVTTYRAIGTETAAQSYPDTGMVYGAADWYDLTVEAGFFGADAGPETSLRESFVLKPGEHENISVEFPTAEPGTLQERWMVRWRVTSRWNNGASTKGEWSEWRAAERMPNSSLSINLEDAASGEGYWLEMPEDDYTFHGTVRWRSEEGDEDIDTERVLRSGAVGSQYIEEPPARLFGGAILEVAGHFRTRAGTGQQSLQRSVTRKVQPAGLPTKDGTEKSDPDQFSVPETNGVILETKATWALSANGVWVPIGSGAGPVHVQDVVLLSGGSPIGSSSRLSAVRWSGSMGYPSSVDPTIRFIFSGGVDAVESASRRARASFDKAKQSVDVRFTLSEEDYGDRITIPLRVKTASGEEMGLMYELSDSSTGTANPPKVISTVVRKLGEASTEAAISESDGGTNITATTSSAWSKAIVTLVTRNAVEMSNVSTTPDGADYDFYEDERPPYVSAVLPLDNTGAGTFQFDLENEAEVTQTFSLDITT